VSEAESINTMLQGSFVKLGEGSYAQKIASAGSAGTNAQTSGPNDASGFDANSVTGPGLGAVIATHTPPVGANGELHLIEVTVWYSGTAPAAAENFNMAFKFGGTQITKIPAIPALHIPTKATFYFVAASGTPFAVIAVAAGTAGTIYNAFIAATKIVS
jgi:hypothetical protein